MVGIFACNFQIATSAIQSSRILTVGNHLSIEITIQTNDAALSPSIIRDPCAVIIKNYRPKIPCELCLGCNKCATRASILMSRRRILLKSACAHFILRTCLRLTSTGLPSTTKMQPANRPSLSNVPFNVCSMYAAEMFVGLSQPLPGSMRATEQHFQWESKLESYCK